VGNGESIVNEVEELWNEPRALECLRCAKSDSSWVVNDIGAAMRFRVRSSILFFAVVLSRGSGGS
jgi:hypothetical protein